MTTSDDPRDLAESVLALRPSEVEAALHGRSLPPSRATVLATGVPSSPGVASGRLATSVDGVLDAAERGEAVVMVVDSTSPMDEVALRVASAVVTTSGGWTSHAAIIARAAGVPAVSGANQVVVARTGIEVGGVRVEVGDWLTVDGGTGELRLGTVSPDPPSDPGLPDEIARVLDAADRLVGGRPAVTVNADTAADVRRGLALGAIGVGLVRTEHMFGAQTDVLWRMLTTTPGATGYGDAALAFESVQRHTLADLLAAVGSGVVTVRLLDAPAEEFGLVGTPRGVRLAASRPDIYRAQLSALSEAVGEMHARDRWPVVRLLVPMVTDPSEVAMLAEWVGEYPALHTASVGAMVETPAAALTTDDLVRHASHVSFGTNDLTQYALGLDRDGGPVGDVAGGGAALDPFRTLHRSVAELIRRSAHDAGAADLSLCGELASTPDGLDLAVELAMSSVSAPPFRVPLARLGLGQRATRRVLGVC